LKSETALFPEQVLSRNNSAILALKLLVTLACFWYLFRHVELAKLREALPELQVGWAAIAVVLLILQIPLVALRLLEIVQVLRIGRFRWSHLCAASAIGQFFGQILPAVTGDGVRAWFLNRFGSSWRDAAVSVVIDRCVGIGLLLVFAFAILLLPSKLDFFAGYRGELVVFLGTVVFAGVIGLVLGARFSAALAERGHVRWIASFLTSAYRVVFGARCAAILGIGCLVHMLTIAAVWSLGRAQGLLLSPSDAAVLFAVMVGVALVPFSVGGWGLRELAMISFFGNYGLTPERALVFSMFFGFACLVASLPGAVVWLVFAGPRPTVGHG